MSNLTGNQIEVLSSLVYKEMYGLEIVKHIKECGGSLNMGTLYNLLNGLEKKGFIEGNYKESTEARRGNRRRYYKITAVGETKLNEIKYSLTNNWKLSF